MTTSSDARIVRGAEQAQALLDRTAVLALCLFVGSFLVLALASGWRFLEQSAAPHFVYQADAWLHGQLHLRLPPPDANDWARVGDRWYVSFPPGPALLMLPGVALLGYQRFDDVAFTVVFAAANVALFFLVLERLRRTGESVRSRGEDVALALFFAFGTVAFSCSVRGEVWFTAEVLGVTATCLYLLAAHRAGHPLLAGLAWGFAAVTRAPLVFTVVFFLAELVAPHGGRAERGGAAWRHDPARWRKLAWFAAGAAPLLAFAAWSNWARFGSPFDFGHAHFWNNRVNADIQRHGLFSLHYLERQLHAAFTRLPRLVDGRLTYHPDGMSLFLTTPLFALLLWPCAKPRLHRTLWATAAVAALPGFFYQNTGYVQFGYRFSLDYTPYLFLLLAIGGRPMGRWFWVLGAAGVFVNTWGALVFAGG